MNVIPAIDLRGGRCVRLYQGDFDQQTTYDADPVSLAAHYESLGFQYLHIVDLDGAKTGDQSNRELVAQIVENTKLTVQLGGGIRDSEAVSDWLDCGVQRCVIGSVAIAEPHRVANWLRRFGPARVVLALDVRVIDGVPQAVTHGWTRESGKSLWDCVDQYARDGLTHVLCTDVARDGAMEGPNAELYRDFIERYPDIELQASGGVRHIEDLQQLRECGAAAAITGRALLDGRIRKEELQPFLRVA